MDSWMAKLGAILKYLSPERTENILLKKHMYVMMSWKYMW